MKFMVYGSSSCTYCVKATNLLSREGYGADYIYINIQNDHEAKKFIVEEKGLKTVPQIFIVDEYKEMNHIGGYEDLVSYLKG